MKPYQSLFFQIGSLALLFFLGAEAYSQESGGNRYFLERHYQGEISATKAYLENQKNIFKFKKNFVIIDVRDASEYKLNHPRGAFHFPYPRIYRECVNDARTEDGACSEGTVNSVAQDPEELFLQVESKFRNKSITIAALCRTGFRSVLAANILAKPTIICDLKGYQGVEYDDCLKTYEGRGFSNVYNIWEGFVGQPKSGIVSAGGSRYQVGQDQELADLTLDDGSEAKGFVAYDLDVNKDGEIGAEDKDGWRYFLGLPYVVGTKFWFRNQAVHEAGYYREP